MGGQLDVKLQLRLLQQLFIVVLLFSSTPLNCHAADTSWIYSQPQLDALQVLWGAWSKSTPNLETNLAGWNSSGNISRWGSPAERFIPCTTWRGVQCLSNSNCTNDLQDSEKQSCNVFITGLTLNNASIVGILPPEIGNITTLLTLEITGNPNLTGAFPETLRNTNPYILDLHDNALSGEIPDFGNMDFATKVDLSGNKFSGSNPIPNITSGMVALQTLNLGGNNFEGEILFDDLEKQYVSKIVQLDVSSNRFSGTVPDLNFMEHLEILNLSQNSFMGRVPSLPNSSVRIVDLSGNGFNDSNPFAQVFGMVNLSTLNLSRNGFEGEIPLGSFNNLGQLVILDLSNNRFNGSLPSPNRNKSNLQILDISNNNFTGTLPKLLPDSSLRILNFSRNAFTGPSFRSWVNDIYQKRLITPGGASYSLKEVYLDSNLIDGTLDISLLAEQGLLSTRSADSLKVFSLMHNNITNVAYDAKNIESILTVIRLQGNPYCHFPDSDAAGIRCFCKQNCSNSGSITSGNNNSRVVITAVVTSVASLLVLVISVAALLYRNRRYKRYLQLQVQQKFEEFEVKPTIFPYNQLRTATRDFHPDMKLGQGAFGAVYKGVLPNGHEIAVKQLFAQTSKGIDEFLNEVVLLTGMKHRNLVNLKGCCIREQQRVLVYEYLDNYDVDQILLVGPHKALLSWPLRLKICLGVARGLHYLHALAHPKIIHRDIKASNILLTKNHESKIADFGLASLFPDEESHVMTQHIAGTKGYLAPEYASYGQLSDKVDVFSFGVLCLEVVSGRKNINEKKPPDEIYLPNWAWKLHRQGRVMDLVDPTINLQGEEKLEVQRLITVSLLCIQMTAEQRPSMERVVAMLQGHSESEAVVLNPGNVEEGLKNMTSMFAFGESGIGTVREEGESSDMESSFMDSSRRAGELSEKDYSSYAPSVELSETRSAR